MTNNTSFGFYQRLTVFHKAHTAEITVKQQYPIYYEPFLNNSFFVNEIIELKNNKMRNKLK